MINVLYALLGGALVALGILAAAVADRVRGIRAQRSAERSAAPRAVATVPAERVKPSAARLPRSEVRMGEMADDVIAALVDSGYKKAVAAEATWGCGATERATLEGWTMAALQRAGKGAPS